MPTPSPDELTFVLAATDLDPPNDPVQLQRWLDQREDWLAGAASLAMRSILGDAAANLEDTLLARGDQGAFDSALPEWRLFVQNVAAEYLGGMYAAGGVAMANLADVLDPEFLAVIERHANQFVAQVTRDLEGYGAAVIAEARQAVVEHVAKATTLEAIKSGILDVTDSASDKAGLIARTETMRAYNTGHMDEARALPPGQRPDKKRWVATRDARTRPDHLEADGQMRALDDAFYVGGVPMDRPHDPTAPAAQVVNCRCTVVFEYE